MMAKKKIWLFISRAHNNLTANIVKNTQIATDDIQVKGWK